MFNKQKSMIVVASFSLMALVAPIGATLGKAPVTSNKLPTQTQVIDDHGRGGREPQPGDDRGRGHGKSGKGSFVRHGGEPEPGDDHGRGGRTPQPGDDRGGRNRLGRNNRFQLFDDRGRGGRLPESGDDRGRGH